MARTARWWMVGLMCVVPVFALAGACGSDGGDGSVTGTAGSRGSSGAGGATGGAGGQGGSSGGGAGATGSGGAGGATGGAGGTGGATGGMAGSAGSGGSAGKAGASGSSGSSGSAGTGGAPGAGPSIGGCAIFPADNAWNRDVSADPLDPDSAAIIANINANGAKMVHPDFGATLEYGIPYVVVPAAQPGVPMTFDYADESDPGPYPFPANAPIEGGSGASGDRHVIAVQQGTCLLYETWSSQYVGPGWKAGSGAKFDLKSNAIRHECWTSADAAGLPVLPGLVRYEEAVTAGVINHALRFTVVATRKAYVHPATHFASSNINSPYPPMGMRVRLKAAYDVSRFTGAAKVIVTALKKYGMILADNGSNWYISGTSNASFNDDNLNALKTLPGDQFEVIKMDKLYTAADCP
jgi:hypothetical protein